MSGKNSTYGKFPVVLGIIVMVFAVIGFGTVTKFVISFVNDLTDNTQEKRFYEEFITPLAMLDPEPFDDITLIKDENAIDACVWDFVKTADNSKIEYDTAGRVVISFDEINKTCNKLFGTEYQLNLKSDYSNDVYEINEAEKKLSVTVTGYMPLYSPRVESVAHKGNVTTLKVGYMPALVDWVEAAKNPKEVKPEKYLTYILRGEKGKQVIVSVKAGK